MRDQPLDLSGRRALLTGGRVKIGFATALRMLRANATVHITTRYPNDAKRRYTAEPDASDWSDRLHIHALDLRDLSALLSALGSWRAGPPFDILVNNAAQSVFVPPETVTALLQGEETATVSTSPARAEPLHALAAIAQPSALQQLDLQRIDSWRQRLGEVSAVDMVEVTLINAIAPFLFASVLRDNLARSPHRDRYIVNVSAVEGRGQIGPPPAYQHGQSCAEHADPDLF